MLHLNLFHYADYELENTTSDNLVAIAVATDIIARQIEPDRQISHTPLVTQPNRYEVDFDPNILNHLDDADADDLNNALGPIGPGDLSYALQWDLHIPGNTTAQVTFNQQITVDLPTGNPGDVNLDGVVDVADLALVGAQWGTDGSGSPFSADIAPPPNGDGIVDVADLALVGANWTASGGPSLGSPGAVPAAPAAGYALILAAALRRSRRD